MKENKEISALMHLIDDPDEEVYKTVSDKILSFGKDIIPNLEHLWETITNTDTQERIELLIHRVHHRDLSMEFEAWKSGEAGLLEGALLVSKYHYPDLAFAPTLKELEKLRRNIWLELNNYLTSFEKVNVFNGIFYNYYKQKSVEVSYENPDTFLMHKALETKKGNSISNGIIYLVLAAQLDLPIYAINIPRQFILGYMNQGSHASMAHSSEMISFYIDPSTGQMYSHKDIENYFKRLSVPPVSSYFKPLSNKRIIQYLLEEISKCYDNERNVYKRDELLYFAGMLD